MASVSNEGANKLDVALNLVPFIDLLSSLVLFLLVTAAWQQISSVSANVSSKGPSHTSVIQQKRLSIYVTNGGYHLHWPEGFRGYASFAAHGPQLEALAKKAAAHGLKLASVSAGDGVEYGIVIKAIDLAKSGGIPSVALGVQ